jgi:hypothetical protein
VETAAAFPLEQGCCVIAYNLVDGVVLNILQEHSAMVFFFILYYDQEMHSYFTNYYTPTCFDTIVSSSGSF